ncbi:MAG: flavodoxin family protein [Anaerolineae bacterium]|nr:flavodoxin family protein [Anaerolineae bacterium]
MKALVVYDSAFGNTEKVAQAMGEALGAEALRPGDVKPEHLKGLDLLIVGSPTQKFTALPSINGFLKGLSNSGLDGVKVAAFDTRFPQSQVDEVGILAFFARLFGYAAEPIGKRLEKKGGHLVVAPEPFFVSDTEGPLLDGELDRAANWARQVAAAM